MGWEKMLVCRLHDITAEGRQRQFELACGIGCNRFSGTLERDLHTGVRNGGVGLVDYYALDPTVREYRGRTADGNQNDRERAQHIHSRGGGPLLEDHAPIDGRWQPRPSGRECNYTDRDVNSFLVGSTRYGSPSGRLPVKRNALRTRLYH